MVWATRPTSPSFSCQWWSKENHPLVRPGLGRVPFERCLLLMLVLRVTMVMMIVIADTSQPLIWTVFLLSRYMSYFPSMPALMFRTSSLQHLRFLRNRPELQKSMVCQDCFLGVALITSPQDWHTKSWTPISGRYHTTSIQGRSRISWSVCGNEVIFKTFRSKVWRKIIHVWVQPSCKWGI